MVVQVPQPHRSCCLLTALSSRFSLRSSKTGSGGGSQLDTPEGSGRPLWGRKEGRRGRRPARLEGSVSQDIGPAPPRTWPGPRPPAGRGRPGCGVTTTKEKAHPGPRALTSPALNALGWTVPCDLLPSEGPPSTDSRLDTPRQPRGAARGLRTTRATADQGGR